MLFSTSARNVLYVNSLQERQPCGLVWLGMNDPRRGVNILQSIFFHHLSDQLERGLAQLVHVHIHLASRYEWNCCKCRSGRR